MDKLLDNPLSINRTFNYTTILCNAMQCCACVAFRISLFALIEFLSITFDLKIKTNYVRNAFLLIIVQAALSFNLKKKKNFQREWERQKLKKKEKKNCSVYHYKATVALCNWHYRLSCTLSSFLPCSEAESSHHNGTYWKLFYLLHKIFILFFFFYSAIVCAKRNFADHNSNRYTWNTAYWSGIDSRCRRRHWYCCCRYVCA